MPLNDSQKRIFEEAILSAKLYILTKEDFQNITNELTSSTFFQEKLKRVEMFDYLICRTKAPKAETFEKEVHDYIWKKFTVLKYDQPVLTLEYKIYIYLISLWLALLYNMDIDKEKRDEVEKKDTTLRKSFTEFLNDFKKNGPKIERIEKVKYFYSRIFRSGPSQVKPNFVKEIAGFGILEGFINISEAYGVPGYINHSKNVKEVKIKYEYEGATNTVSCSSVTTQYELFKIISDKLKIPFETIAQVQEMAKKAQETIETPNKNPFLENVKEGKTIIITKKDPKEIEFPSLNKNIFEMPKFFNDYECESMDKYPKNLIKDSANKSGINIIIKKGLSIPQVIKCLNKFLEKEINTENFLKECKNTNTENYKDKSSLSLLQNFLSKSNIKVNEHKMISMLKKYPFEEIKDEEEREMYLEVLFLLFLKSRICFKDGIKKYEGQFKRMIKESNGKNFILAIAFVLLYAPHLIDHENIDDILNKVTEQVEEKESIEDEMKILIGLILADLYSHYFKLGDNRKKASLVFLLYNIREIRKYSSKAKIEASFNRCDFNEIVNFFKKINFTFTVEKESFDQLNVNFTDKTIIQTSRWDNDDIIFSKEFLKGGEEYKAIGIISNVCSNSFYPAATYNEKLNLFFEFRGKIRVFNFPENNYIKEISEENFSLGIYKKIKKCYFPSFETLKNFCYRYSGFFANEYFLGNFTFNSIVKDKQTRKILSDYLKEFEAEVFQKRRFFTKEIFNIASGKILLKYHLLGEDFQNLELNEGQLNN